MSKGMTGGEIMVRYLQATKRKRRAHNNTGGAPSLQLCIDTADPSCQQMSIEFSETNIGYSCLMMHGMCYSHSPTLGYDCSFQPVRLRASRCREDTKPNAPYLFVVSVLGSPKIRQN